MNSINLFNGLDKNQIEEFNSLCTIKRFESKSLIIRDNTKINGVYILKTGICQVYSLEQDGKEFIFTQLHSGEVVGEMSCLDNQPSSANVKAITNCEIHFIEKEKFVNFYKNISTVEMLGKQFDKMDDQSKEYKNIFEEILNSIKGDGGEEFKLSEGYDESKTSVKFSENVTKKLNFN